MVESVPVAICLAIENLCAAERDTFLFAMSDDKSLVLCKVNVDLNEIERGGG